MVRTKTNGQVPSSQHLWPRYRTRLWLKLYKARHTYTVPNFSQRRSSRYTPDKVCTAKRSVPPPGGWRKQLCIPRPDPKPQVIPDDDVASVSAGDWRQRLGLPPFGYGHTIIDLTADKPFEYIELFREAESDTE